MKSTEENNMAATLKALRDISRVAKEMEQNTPSDGRPVDALTVVGWASRISDIINSAFDVILRNCDVGTAEEQAERYMNFCHNYPRCTGCPCVGRIQYHQCEFAWAQMPYEGRRREVSGKQETMMGCGDAAKLREALLRCDAIAQLPEVRNEQSIKDMRNIIRQALSAPPMNCNRFGTFAQAKAEWWKTEVLPRVEGVVGGEEPPFEEWLFLPATEQKGENNANK